MQASGDVNSSTLSSLTTQMVCSCVVYITVHVNDMHVCTFSPTKAISGHAYLLQELILAVPPFEAANQGPELAMPEFEDLRVFVDFFTLMTYDASSPSNPGPNAPWKWVKTNVDAMASSTTDRYGLRYYFST